VQARANQPRPDKDDSHDHWESILQMEDCEKLGEVEEEESDSSEKSGSVERKGEKSFEDGKYGGNNWSI
jgi:hypothetical protein